MSLKKVDILAIGVHPDDVELSCSGILLRQIANGNSVGLLDLTRGELGSRGTAETRDIEAEAAGKLMGAKFRYNLDMGDGFFTYSRENLLKIISIIRASRPSIVLSNAPDDRHPDHGRAAKLVSDACFYAGLIKINTTDKSGKNQEKWRPDAVYHYIQDFNLKPDFVVDISEFIEQKLKLITTFKSQFYDPSANPGNEPSTPISGKEFLEFIKAKAATYGRHAGFHYAEGLIAGRTIGVRNLFDLS